MNFEVTVHDIELDHELRCTGCQVTLRSFIEAQEYGCPACKESFSHPEAEGIIQGLSQALCLADLKRRLRRAVEAEDFEVAARLRDLINNVGGAETAALKG